MPYIHCYVVLILMKKLTDKNGILIKIGDKIQLDKPVAYIGGKFPEPIIGVVIEENGELICNDGEYKTPIKNFKYFSWEIIG